MSYRAERVADLLRAEISAILQREVKDRRVHLVTVTEVHASPDLRHARVRLSILGDDAERELVLKAVQHAGGFIRRQLGKRLTTRVTPELVFELDRGAEYSQQISDLLEELHHDEPGT